MIVLVAARDLRRRACIPPDQTSPMCFLVTEFGKPFAVAGFGNKTRDGCNTAGLPQCSAHGLRKATMCRMAELGFGNQTMKAVSGHSKDEEVARYAAATNQRQMADDAIGQLARWEKSNLDPWLDTGTV